MKTMIDETKLEEEFGNQQEISRLNERLAENKNELSRLSELQRKSENRQYQSGVACRCDG